MMLVNVQEKQRAEKSSGPDEGKGKGGVTRTASSKSKAAKSKVCQLVWEGLGWCSLHGTL